MYEGRGSMHLFPFPKDIDVYKWGLLYNLRPILKIDKGLRGGGGWMSWGPWVAGAHPSRTRSTTSLRTESSIVPFWRL